MKEKSDLVLHGPVPSSHPRDMWAVFHKGEHYYLMIALDDDVSEFDIGCKIVEGHEDEADHDCGYCDMIAQSTATFGVVSCQISQDIVKDMLEERLTKEDIGYIVQQKFSKRLFDVEEVDCPVYCGDFQKHRDRVLWVLECHDDTGMSGNANEYQSYVEREFRRVVPLLTAKKEAKKAVTKKKKR